MPPISAASTTVESLLRLLGSSAAMAAFGRDLAVTGRSAAVTAAGSSPSDEGQWLAREGFALLPGIVEPRVCAALVSAVEALHASELPATFLYAFDEAWAIGRAVRERITAVIGHDYRLVEDIWAWRIAPGTGRGWPAHRGIAHARLDRDAPEVINVWLALSDVTAERACMHAIPLDDDPGYPGALGDLEAPLASVRAMPANAGDALFWNANVLHWGGLCSPRARGPRVSCSFTLCRADAASRFPELTLLPSPDGLDLAARMDVVARMILLYGGPDRGDVGAVVGEWASVTHGLASRFGQRKAP